MGSIIIGDAFTTLSKIADETVDCCVTSPPYYGLRDYHAPGQIGMESTVGSYISRLVSVFREVRRVLRQDGSLWLNLGDTYSKNKNLLGVPWRVALALQEDGWILRQDIIWDKPNPMPESVKDRCTKSHEYIFLFAKSRKYYFDAEAISEPVKDSTIKRCAEDIEHQRGSFRQQEKKNGPMKACMPRFGGKKYTDTPEIFYRTKSGNCYNFRPRRNKRSVWHISTTPYKGAHFAVFPSELAETCIKAGCKPSGTVLDPFVGSGTTVAAAIKLGRDYIGIEINPEYAKLTRERVKGIWGENQIGIFETK